MSYPYSVESYETFPHNQTHPYAETFEEYNIFVGSCGNCAETAVSVHGSYPSNFKNRPPGYCMRCLPRKYIKHFKKTNKQQTNCIQFIEN